MKILVNEKISQHKYKTPEGYLICVDSVLARTGPQTYRKSELFVDAEDDSEIEVGRNPEEVFAPETLASFENKPITVEHPHEDVNVENYKDYAVGFVRDVKKGKFDGQDVILGTLVITDKDAIEGIENGEHVELSCGYDCDIEDGDDGYQQKHIRGNHVALCEAGRAGVAKIVDSVEDDYNYDIETNFDKILYDLTANNIDYSSAAYDTQLIWFKDDTEYEKAKKYLDRKRWKYKEGVNKKGVKYFEIKDAVKDKDWISDSMKDAVEPEAKGQYKGYTIIAKSTGRANAPTLLEIYDGNKKMKSFFSADEDLDDAIHDVPKYWPLPPLPQKKYDMLSSYLNMISTFTSRDIDIKDVLRPLSGKGFKYTIDKIEGWIWKKGEMAYKNYYVSLDEYTDKFIVTLYADPNQDWKVNEVSAYVNDSCRKFKDETPYEEQTEKLEEDVATFDDKFSTAKKEIITWWKEVERWNEKAGRPFNIDNGNYDNAYDLWSAMYDMFTESKLKAERPDLANQGQRIYKKWEYDFNWTFNDSVHDVEPRSGESKDEFISRFMEETKSEYPDEKQRVAVAYSYWEKAHGKDSIKDAKELSAKSIDNLDEMMNHYKRKHPQAEFGEIEKRKDYYVVKVLRDSKLNDDYSTRAPGGKIKALFETESGKKYAVVERRDDIAILGGYDTNTGHWDTIMSGFTNLGSAKQAVEGYMRKWGDRPARNKVEIKGINELESLTDKMLPIADKMVKLRQEYEAMRKQYHQLSKKQDQIDDQDERNKFFEKNMHGLYDKWMKKSDELIEVREQYKKLHDKFYLIGGRINRSNDVDALKLMNELEAKVKKANDIYYNILGRQYYQDPELGDSMKDSIYSLNIVGQKSRKLVRAKDAREAIDKYNKMFPKDKIKSVKKTDKFNNIIDIIGR